jgi:ribonuclease HII
MSNILGIDEAGRGCLVGPMVIVGVVARRVQQVDLVSIGVKDSKEIKGATKQETMLLRKDLAAEILSIVGLTGYFMEHTSAKNITEYHDLMNLNAWERNDAQWIIDKAAIFHLGKIDEVIADGHLIFKDLDVSSLDATLNAMDKADSLNVVVSAASIVAKTLRDAAVHKIMGDAFWDGAGYCNQGTKNWLLEDFEGRRQYCRQNWKWFKKIEEERK